MYAAYGSNLHPLRLKARIPAAELLGTAFLPGWELKFHKRGGDGSGKGNIVASAGGVYVAVYDIADDGMAKLDGIEGAGYRRERIEIPDFGECFTYVAEDSHVDDALKPFDWYREMVLLGCRSLAFPEAYGARIGRVAPDVDPDPERSRENWAIVERLRVGTASVGASSRRD